jgi:hypothetical protein
VQPGKRDWGPLKHTTSLKLGSYSWSSEKGPKFLILHVDRTPVLCPTGFSNVNQLQPQERPHQSSPEAAVGRDTAPLVAAAAEAVAPSTARAAASLGPLGEARRPRSPADHVAPPQ